MNKRANSFSFATIIFIVLGIIVPFWPISLPLFWSLAYICYKTGKAPAPSITDLHTAQELLDRGTITQEEFDRIRANVLGR